MDGPLQERWGFESERANDTNMTYPFILAKILVKNPYETFAYLPFGDKYWFEQYGAVPASMIHDDLEFDRSVPVPKEKAIKAAAKQYGFCPDVVDQGPEDATVGWLADVLRQSNGGIDRDKAS